jgi:predicted aminopeptidase
VFLSILAGSFFLSGAGVIGYQPWFSAPVNLSKFVIIVVTYCSFVYGALSIYRKLKK